MACAPHGISINIAMLRKAVEAAAEATGESVFIVVGVASLVGSVTDVPPELTRTEDVDLYPLHGQDRFDMDEVDEKIGLGSKFAAQNGFYVQRVGSWTVSTQPGGWLERASTLEFGKVKAICLSPLDLAYNKLEAGRSKDRAFVGAMLESKIINTASLLTFIREGAPDESIRALVEKRALDICRSDSGDK